MANRIFSDIFIRTRFCTIRVIRLAAVRVEQSNPCIFSIIKQEVNKLCFCRPANVVLSFWNPLSDQTAQTRHTTFWYYHVVIQQTICACRRLFAPFRLRRHSPMVFVYRRIFVRAPIRLRRCISAASVQPDQSLRCSWMFVCILHNYMRVLQFALSRSLINVFTVRMAN